MIKYSEIESVFLSSDLVVHEYNLETDDDIDLPYLVYATAEGESFSADGICYYKTLIVALAFVDATINFALQRKIEKVFDENGTFYDKSLTFNDDSRLYTITYSFVVEDDAID